MGRLPESRLGQNTIIRQGLTVFILPGSAESRWTTHSITRPRGRAALTSSPSVFAVLRLMARRILVGCFTGKSEGLSPLRILPAHIAASRYDSGRSVP